MAQVRSLQMLRGGTGKEWGIRGIKMDLAEIKARISRTIHVMIKRRYR